MERRCNKELQKPGPSATHSTLIVWEKPDSIPTRFEQTKSETAKPPTPSLGVEIHTPAGGSTFKFVVAGQNSTVIIGGRRPWYLIKYSLTFLLVDNALVFLPLLGDVFVRRFEEDLILKA